MQCTHGVVLHEVEVLLKVLNLPIVVPSLAVVVVFHVRADDVLLL